MRKQLATPVSAAWRSAWQWRSSLVLVILAALIAIISQPTQKQARRFKLDLADAAVAAQLADRINPNAAPWSSLTRLPGIGPGRAGAIVEYRTARTADPAETDAAFTCAQDLGAVKGVGPATVAKIKPYLVFNQP